MVEFDEKVFARSEGKQTAALTDLDAFSDSNIAITVKGPEKSYTFSWRILNYADLKPGGSGFKQVEIYLFDFKQSLIGGSKEVKLLFYFV